MKRKLIFGIVLAMILAPMSAFSVFAAEATLSLTPDTVKETVTLTGSGFAPGEQVGVISGYGNVTPLPSPDADWIGQDVADSEGKISVVIPVAKKMYGGDDYSVRVSSASTGTKIVYLSDEEDNLIESSYAKIEAPLRWNTNIKKVTVIPAEVDSNLFSIRVSNSAVGTVKAITDDAGHLTGIEFTAKRVGTTSVVIETTDGGGAMTAIMVNVGT
jgi:hypothetical protein